MLQVNSFLCKMIGYICSWLDHTRERESRKNDVVNSLLCFNLKVIVANVQSMQRTLEEIERCKGELHLPQGAEESLPVFSRARLLLQPLDELQQLTHQQAALLQVLRVV